MSETSSAAPRERLPASNDLDGERGRRVRDLPGDGTHRDAQRGRHAQSGRRRAASGSWAGRPRRPFGPTAATVSRIVARRS
jgi:hypothetical protein